MKKLYRSATDRVLAGICGGLGQYANIDSTVIRLIFVALMFVSVGSIILLYLIAALIIPKEPGYTDI